MNKPVYVLGLNFAYHELSACIIKNGVVIAAVEEERFSRIKRGKKALINNPDAIPLDSIKYCLKAANIKMTDVSHIGLSFFPDDRLKNIGSDSHFIDGDWGSENGEKIFIKKIKRVPSLLGKAFGGDTATKIMWIPHHLCHASSAFFVSPYKEANILSVDGIGEFSSTWIGFGSERSINNIKEIPYPNSLGFLWEKISKYLGFTEYDSSKVMGLSAYGNSNKFYSHFKKIITLEANGGFIIDNEVLRFRADEFRPLEDLFGIKKINSAKEVSKDQYDIAAALQKITNEVMLHMASFLRKSTGSKKICLAGGVALNCVSNESLLKSGLFDGIYVQPAANDAGTAMGAAYYIWHQILNKPRGFVLRHSYWGPSYSDVYIESILKKSGVTYGKSKNIAREVAYKISQGNIIGWFQGRAEWGPRALGNRSLLADPRLADMKDILNSRIKKRESFRPFAPSVLAEKAKEWFVIPSKCSSISTEFMEINFSVKKTKRNKIPAVTHEDGTSRVQIVNRKTNRIYHKLISNFYNITGVPLLLNTSFNDNEPIVCSPEDAIKTFLRTKMDYLAIGNYLVSK